MRTMPPSPAKRAPAPPPHRRSIAGRAAGVGGILAAGAFAV